MKFSIRQSDLNEALSNLIRITEKGFENVKIQKQLKGKNHKI